MAEASYDVIVLGAGLGGLAAGLTLLRSGVSVLMVESRGHVGGRCQTIPARHCLLPVGTVVIPCGDFLEGLFTDFEVPFDVVRVPTRGVYEIGGQRIPVPGRGALRTLANAALPDAPDLVDNLLAAVRRALAWAEPSASISMRDWLAQFVTAPALLSAFQAMAGAYLATNSYEVSARAFVRYLRGAAGRASIGIPRHGWGALVEPLGSRFQELGGQLWTACPVQSIRADNRRVSGAVVRREGTDVEVRAPVVVSDLGPQSTVGKVASEAWDLGYADDVAAIPTAPGVALFFRHDEELIEGGGPLLPSSAQRACFAITPTMLAPGLGDGHSHWTEVLVTLADSRVQTVAAGQAAARAAVREVHEIFPALHGRSPFKQLSYRGDWPIYRTWPGWEMPYRTPVEGLFLVGDAVRQPDQNGTSAAAQSGVLVAGQVLAQLGGTRQAG